MVAAVPIVPARRGKFMKRVPVFFQRAPQSGT
jgi:hypothetical protein